jgi:plastocyanin
MRSARALAIGLSAAILTVVLAACAGQPPGWTYAPAPPATPQPSFDEGVASAPPSEGPVTEEEGGESPDAGGGGGGGGEAIEITAVNIAFDQSQLEAPADTPFQIIFDNQDAGVPHNVAIHEGSPTGPEVWKGEIFNGVETRTYDVPAIPAGEYGFVCSVHPNMTGTLTAS